MLCHFCFKQKKVTNEVLRADNAKKSQNLICSIILLKAALEALPLLSKVISFQIHTRLFKCPVHTCDSFVQNFRYLRKQRVFFLQTFTNLFVKTKNLQPLERGNLAPANDYTILNTGLVNRSPQ